MNGSSQQSKKKFSKKDYEDAIAFALNYPVEIDFIRYDEDKDIFRVVYLDGGWYDMNLLGSFVRSCLKWKGKKQWI